MRAKFIYEKFVEDSDPVEDLGLGPRKQISKWMEEIGQHEDTDDNTNTDNNALCQCAWFGKTKWAKYLLANGADVHFADDRPLRWAAKKGHAETVKALLDAGADVHAWNDYALRYAVDNKHIETVKVLLGAGAIVEKDLLYNTDIREITELYKLLGNHYFKNRFKNIKIK